MSTRSTESGSTILATSANKRALPDNHHINCILQPDPEKLLWTGVTRSRSLRTSACLSSDLFFEEKHKTRHREGTANRDQSAVNYKVRSRDSKSNNSRSVGVRRGSWGQCRRGRCLGRRTHSRERPSTCGAQRCRSWTEMKLPKASFLPPRNCKWIPDITRPVPQVGACSNARSFDLQFVGETGKGEKATPTPHQDKPDTPGQKHQGQPAKRQPRAGTQNQEEAISLLVFVVLHQNGGRNSWGLPLRRATRARGSSRLNGSVTETCQRPLCKDSNTGFSEDLHMTVSRTIPPKIITDFTAVVFFGIFRINSIRNHLFCIFFTYRNGFCID